MDAENVWPFGDFWSMTMSKDIFDVHKHFIEQLVKPPQEDLFPYQGKKKANGIVKCLIASNPPLSKFNVMASRSNDIQSVKEWCIK